MNEDSEMTTTTETELETTDADDDLAMKSSHVEVFCMDNEEGDSSSDSAALTLDLEIATVYKPRPFRRRVASTMQGQSERRNGKGKKPKHLLVHTRTQPNAHSEHNVHSHAHPNEPQVHSTTGSKQGKRRAARDKRREAKRDPHLMHVSTINAEEMGELVLGLESLHVTLKPEDLRVASAPPEVETSVHDDARHKGGLNSIVHAPAADFLSSKQTPEMSKCALVHPLLFLRKHIVTSPLQTSSLPHLRSC